MRESRFKWIPLTLCALPWPFVSSGVRDKLLPSMRVLFTGGFGLEQSHVSCCLLQLAASGSCSSGLHRSFHSVPLFYNSPFFPTLGLRTETFPAWLLPNCILVLESLSEGSLSALENERRTSLTKIVLLFFLEGGGCFNVKIRGGRKLRCSRGQIWEVVRKKWFW